MATLPRQSSLMPSIKCSTCGEQVEISMMGEHICGATPPLPSLLDPLPGKTGRMIPPTVDTNAASKLLRTTANPIRPPLV